MTILIRIDDEERAVTLGQRSIRFALEDNQPSVVAAAKAALDQAPPLEHWETY